MREEKKNCTSCVSVGVKLMLFQYRSAFMYENQDIFKICMLACIHYTTVHVYVCARNKSLLLETTEREINTKKRFQMFFYAVRCSKLCMLYLKQSIFSLFEREKALMRTYCCWVLLIFQPIGNGIPSSLSFSLGYSRV